MDDEKRTFPSWKLNAITTIFLSYFTHNNIRRVWGGRVSARLSFLPQPYYSMHHPAWNHGSYMPIFILMALYFDREKMCWATFVDCERLSSSSPDRCLCFCFIAVSDTLSLLVFGFPFIFTKRQKCLICVMEFSFGRILSVWWTKPNTATVFYGMNEVKLWTDHVACRRVWT